MPAILGTRLPYPVAAACARMQAAGDDETDLLRHLLFAAESLLQFVGSTLLIDASEAVKADRAGGALRHELHRLKLPQGGMGLWCHCLRALCPEEPFLPEFGALRRDRGRLERLQWAASRMTEERNHLAHPVREVPRTEAARRLATLRPAFDLLLQELDFLGDYHLLTVDRCRHERRGGFRLRVRSALGPQPNQPPFSLDCARPLNEGDVLLVRLDRGDEEGLILSPLYLVQGPPDDFSKGLFAYRRTDGQRLLCYGVADPEEVYHVELAGHAGLLKFLLDGDQRPLRGPLGLSRESCEALRHGLRPHSGGTAPGDLRPISGSPWPSPPPEGPAAIGEEPPEALRPKQAAAAARREPARRGRKLALLLLGGFAVGLLGIGGQRLLPGPEARSLVLVPAAAPPGAGVEPEPGGAASGATDLPRWPPGDLAEEGVGPDARLAASAPETPWTLLETGLQAPLMDVWADEEGRLLVVGAQGTVLSRAARGGRLRESRARGDVDLFGAFGNGDDLFAVGKGGTIGRSADGGASWQWSTWGTREPLMAVWGRGADEVYAAGGGGVMVRSRDRGRTWEPVRSGVKQTIRSLRGTGTTLWGAYYDGLLWHEEQGPIQRYRTERSEWLWDLWPGERAVLAVGQRGLVLRSTDRVHWEALQTAPPNDLTGIWGRGNDVLYAVGDGGLVLRGLDGGRRWQRDRSGALAGLKGRLYRIRGTARGDLYICGAGGVLLHRRLPPAP